MRKSYNVRIRIGASHDDVEIRSSQGSVMFDRCQMRKDGQGKMQGALRRQVVAFAEDLGIAKDKRRDDRRRNMQRDKIKRERRSA